MTAPSTSVRLDLDALRASLAGTAIEPGSPEYDASRTVASGDDLHPAIIVRAANARDVVTTVNLARETGLELAVRSGGHSGAGHGSTEGGILLDVAGLKDLEIDVAGRTAWVGSGMTAGELTAALSEHGLAVGFGDTGSVGIGGITVGGGIGFLVRKAGMTIDNLLSADVVLADGRLVRTDAEHEPDLFWAIRGGGGNFGVVTRFRFRLLELPSIVGGMLVLPATADTVAGFIAAAEAASEDVSTIANVMPCPPLPFVPEEHHGSLVIFAMLVHSGDPAEGEAAMAPFRALATPLGDALAPMSYAGMFPPEAEAGAGPAGEEEAPAEEDSVTYTSRTMFLDHVDHAVAATIVDRVAEHQRTSGALMVAAQLRVLGGAMARVPVEATAFAHRRSRIMFIAATMVGSRDELPAHAAWMRDLLGSLRQGDEGAYVNFLTDEGPERVRAAYPGATWDRLAAIKGRYDPTNLFRRNQNIEPSPVAG